MMPDSKNKNETLKFLLICICFGAMFGSAIFVGCQRYAGRHSLIKSTSIEAELICRQIRSPLTSRDHDSTVKTLNMLKYQRSVVFGCVYDNEGKLFARYYRPDIFPQNLAMSGPPKDKYNFNDGYLKVSGPVVYKDKDVGTVYLWVEL